MKLSIIMPCLNEESTLKSCIDKALAFLRRSDIQGEIIIADNGSNDNSVAIALENGARVTHVPKKGYGVALISGIGHAHGEYIVMGDADDSYDFSNLDPFIQKLDEGYDLVMGNRFKGGIKKGAMPFLHRYLGNPVLSFIGRLFFRVPIGDFHCGLRAFTKQAFDKINLKATGMEFASEMVVKASMYHLKITEVPTTLSPDGRNRPPHLSTWRDGWRHLRFLLLYSPKWLLFIPGMLFLLFGLIIGSILLIAPLKIGPVTFDINTLLYIMTIALIGSQLLITHFVVVTYVNRHQVYPLNSLYGVIADKFNLEKGIFIGILLTLTGTVYGVVNYYQWSAVDFGNLVPTHFIRHMVPSIFLIFIGMQIVTGSFFATLIKEK